MAIKLVYVLALAASLPIAVGCTSTTTKPVGAQQSFFDKMGSQVKNGTSKMVAAVTPKRKSKFAEPASMPSGKPGPAVFVAAAQMHEQAGNFDEAEANYRKALEIDQHHLPTLVAFARLEDRRSNFEAATRFYQRAIKKYPKDASVRNDLGLCYHRRGMLNEATRELKRAVEFDGENKRYRNNLAAAYVEQGKNKEALAHLMAAHGQAVGHYNLGYLLTQKQDSEGALHHFRMAAQQDPNLVAAHQWIARLSTPDGAYASYTSGQTPGVPQQAHQPHAGTDYVAERFAPEPAHQYAPAGQSAPYTASYPRSGQPAADPMPPLPNP